MDSTEAKSHGETQAVESMAHQHGRGEHVVTVSVNEHEVKLLGPQETAESGNL